MSTSAFGGDLRLINQVVMLGNKLGDFEQISKMFASDKEFLAYALDFAAFHFGWSCPVFDNTGKDVQMRLVCFSATSSVHNDEANLRVKRFGRYATHEELEQLFKRLKNNDNLQGKFCYPIITHSIASSYRTDDYYRFTELIYSRFRGLEFGKSGRRWTGSDKSGMIWSPATTFAVVAHSQPSWNVLSSRKDLGELELPEQ